MRKIIAEAKLKQAISQSNLFLVDDKERGLFMNLKVASKAMYALKPYVGQIVTISIETSEELPCCCCSPDFEERVLEIIREMFRKVK